MIEAAKGTSTIVRFNVSSSCLDLKAVSNVATSTSFQWDCKISQHRHLGRYHLYITEKADIPSLKFEWKTILIFATFTIFPVFFNGKFNARRD